MKRLNKYIENKKVIAKKAGVSFKYYVVFISSLFIFQSIVIMFYIFILLILLYNYFFYESY